MLEEVSSVLLIDRTRCKCNHVSVLIISSWLSLNLFVTYSLSASVPFSNSMSVVLYAQLQLSTLPAVCIEEKST